MKKKTWIISAIVAVVVIILLLSSIGTISAGERGVKARFGKVVGVLDTGLYFKTPFVDQITKIDVQTQKEQTEATAASSDLQNVNTTVAINYNIDTTKVADLYIKLGTEYKSKVIDPAIQEVVKATTAKYTASELITKRAEATDLIRAGLAERLATQDISVTSVSIVNFKFSDSFESAIEAKVTAEQNAQAAKNKLDQVKYEAEQTVTSAQAEAEAIKIKTQAVNSQGGKDYVSLQAIDKWDGHLPVQMIPGSSVPFINVNK